MTSQARLLANRRNAGKSTGPRTHAGKARSSGNARRHGLSSALACDEDAARLVQALAPGEDRPAILARIRQVAEALLHLERVEAKEREIIEVAEYQLLALAPHLAPGGRLAALKAAFPETHDRHGVHDLLVTLTVGASTDPLARRAAARHAARLELAPLERYRRRALSALRTAVAKWMAEP